MYKCILTLILPLFFMVTYPLRAQKEDENSFKLPEYKKFVMQNGLTIYLMEQHEVPLIYVSFVLPAGAIYDGDKSGLASLTAESLLFGTKNYSKKNIEEALDFIGATYEASAEEEYAEISMSFVDKDQETVLTILKDIVINPVFPPEEFQKRKTRLLVELEHAKERPASVINSYYNKFIYQDHPYGNPVSGTIGSVSKFSIQDIINFYKTYYHPADAAVAVVGDFEMTKMEKRITDLFQSWEGSNKNIKSANTTVPEYNHSRVLLINKDDATETRFLIGGYGIKRSNPDYVAVQVVNTILGGRFTSWLNDELRVNRGLTYGARSYFRCYKNSGTFIMSSFTNTEYTVEAIDVTLATLVKLHTKGIDVATLTSAQNYIKGQYPPRYETAGSLAVLLTSMFIYDFDESFINNFQQNVDDMTVARANTIIDKYFPEDNLQFVLVGKSAEIRHSVRKYGELYEKEIKADGF